MGETREARRTGETIEIPGVPNERQKEFFRSRCRFTAYGGARGGGKSWALRRKLVGLALVYPGIRCLLVRRSYPELRGNHLLPFLREYGALVTYLDGKKLLLFRNGSTIELGYCADDGDALRYQGQEYDVIAIDEATQLSEYRFSILKACLRGTGDYPKRMYLTCNPGGIGHAWVKRLFLDREYRRGESPADYCFIPACVYDNEALLSKDAGYVSMLESLPDALRDAWLYGRWDVFEGQFFPEFSEDAHVVTPSEIPDGLRYFAALDYGFDMLACLLCGVDRDGRVYVEREHCESGLILSDAGRAVAALCAGRAVEYAVASPDLWNRRQDSGKSGFETMQAVKGMPPMRPADDRRIAGWRLVREYLARGGDASGQPRLLVSRDCRELVRCLPLLLYDKSRREDASSEPHAVTHAPEALRYALMSRAPLPEREAETPLPFTFRGRSGGDPLYAG